MKQGIFSAGAAMIALAGNSAAWAQAAPPALTPGTPGPAIVQENGQPYTQNIGNGTQPVHATVTGSERGLNIAFSNLTDIDPNYLTLPQVVVDRVEGMFVLRTVGTNTARYGFEPAGSASGYQFQSGFPESTFTDSYAYRLFETDQINSVTVGGGVSAVVRAGGVQYASATASSAAAAQSQALAQIGALALPGRRLPAVITATGLVESTSEARSSAITARDSYVVTIVTFGPDNIVIGAQGRCQQFVSGCQGGLSYAVGDDETNFNTYLLEDVYVTNTLTRTVTSTGTITIDIPFAAYGRVHAGVQTAGFDLAQRFLARLRRAGSGEGNVALGRGRATMFLEATGFSGDYAAQGAIAASHAGFEGMRGGVTLPLGEHLTLGLAAEGGHWRWRHADTVLPESAEDSLWRIGGLAGWQKGPWHVAAGAFTGRQQVRATASSTLGGGTSRARYAATVLGAGVEAGRAFDLGKLALTPTLALDWLGWHRPAFTESGGLAPLSVAGAKRAQLRPSLGLAADWRGRGFVLGATARGFLVTGDRQGLVSATDAATPGGFRISGSTAAGSGAELGAHLAVVLAPGISLNAAYAARLAGGHTSHSGEAGIRVAF